MTLSRTFSWSAMGGAAVLLVAIFYLRPETDGQSWATLMLLLAALVWMPIALYLLAFSRNNPPYLRWELLRYGTLPAAISLVVAEILPQGILASLMALPWLGVTLLVFSEGLERLKKHGLKSAGEMAIYAGCLMLPVGSVWALFDRMGYGPLGFDPAIVLLTGVHFHYAGFFFPLLAGLAMRQYPSKVLKIACWLAVLSVPMTAVGITVSQVWGSFLPETLAAGTVAVAGWCCAAGYLRIVFSEKTGLVPKICWSLLALSLLFSMTLALGYALRPWWPLEWLNIPWMRAWHGTVNAVGVAGLGLLGWNWGIRELGN